MNVVAPRVVDTVESYTVHLRCLTSPWQISSPDCLSASWHFFIKGEGTLQLTHQNKAYHCNQGDFIYLGQEVNYAINSGAPQQRSTPPYPCLLLSSYVHFDRSKLWERYANLKELRHVKNGPQSIYPWVGFFLKLCEENCYSKQSAAPQKKQIFERLSKAIIQVALAEREITRSTEFWQSIGSDDQRIGKLLPILCESLDKEWTLAAMAKHCSLSVSAFSARFNRLFGVSPGRFLSLFRLYYAAHLLRYTDVSAQEAAFMSGYQSNATFSRMFKALFDVTPASIRSLKSCNTCIQP